jgi:hypothetical protein
MNSRWFFWRLTVLTLVLAAGCGARGRVTPFEDHPIQAVVDGYRWHAGPTSGSVAEIRQGPGATVLQIRGRYATPDGASREIVITVSGYHGPGRYRLGALEEESYASYHTRSRPHAEPVWYTTGEASAGHVWVHPVDEEGVLIAGTFEFVAERPNGIAVRVADGRFRGAVRTH